MLIANPFILLDNAIILSSCCVEFG